MRKNRRADFDLSDRGGEKLIIIIGALVVLGVLVLVLLGKYKLNIALSELHMDF